MKNLSGTFLYIRSWVFLQKHFSRSILWQSGAIVGCGVRIKKSPPSLSLPENPAGDFLAWGFCLWWCGGGMLPAIGGQRKITTIMVINWVV